MNRVIRVALRGVALGALAGGGMLGTASAAAAALPPIKHVFVIVGENESASTTFGASSPAPYLSQTLKADGAFIQNYYGVGHNSLDNYIAMVSGQAPNPSTSADCGTFANFPSDSMNSSGQENGAGCVYPTDVPSLMSQMDAKGVTWKGYMDGMGLDPARESATCAHPAVGAVDNTEGAENTAPFDAYATKHDPFLYFHSVIDNQSSCDAHVVNASQLATDLASVSTTPNYSFITPNLCDDGHNTTGQGGTCPSGGGLAQYDTYLQQVVPQIVNSPAYKQDGLLIVLFDEAVGDATSCCGELPGPGEPFPGLGTGTGGGITGAVLLSQYIKAGTVTQTPYNHYSMLGSVEDLFGLSRIGYAAGTTAFGSDVFTNFGSNPPPPNPVAPVISSFKVKPSKVSHKHENLTISYTESEVATTKLTFEKVSNGVKQKGKKGCKALRPGKTKPKHTSSCKVIKVLGTISHTDTAGANKIVFNGKIKGHSLAAGSYIVSAVPTASGLKGKAHTAKFKVT